MCLPGRSADPTDCVCMATRLCASGQQGGGNGARLARLMDLASLNRLRSGKLGQRCSRDPMRPPLREHQPGRMHTQRRAPRSSQGYCASRLRGPLACHLDLYHFRYAFGRARSRVAEPPEQTVPSCACHRQLELLQSGRGLEEPPPL